MKSSPNRLPARPWLVTATLFFGMIALTACDLVTERSPEARTQGIVFVPPTLAVTPTPPIPTPEPILQAAEAVRPTGTPACISDLTYLNDLTIPDGVQVLPGEILDKRWAVRNSGECNWDERYTLQLTDGPAMGAPATQALFPARSGTEPTLRILFTAPDTPGIQRSAWQAHDPAGQPFGDPIFIEIIVLEQSNAVGD
jgi:hypothetical protein